MNFIYEAYTSNIKDIFICSDKDALISINVPLVFMVYEVDENDHYINLNEYYTLRYSNDGKHIFTKISSSHMVRYLYINTKKNKRNMFIDLNDYEKTLYLLYYNL